MSETERDSLDAVLDRVWRALADAVDDRASPLRTPALATVGRDGRPAVRTVVLRGVDTDRRRLLVHTDARSAKAAELAATPAVALHAYDAAAAVQLRLDGDATLLRGAPARAAWGALPAASRAAYRTDPAPGRPVAGRDGVALVPEAAAAGRLVVVAIAVVAIDWLHLAAPIHRRARFRWTADGPAAAWLAP